MHDAILCSSRDTLLIAIPFLGMLLAGLFRLDELFAAPKKVGRQRRPPCGLDLDGRPILCDPDGRPWRTPRLSEKQDSSLPPVQPMVKTCALTDETWKSTNHKLWRHTTVIIGD